MTAPSNGDKPRRPVVVSVAGLLLATGLGVTALLGGLDDAPDTAPPQHRQGHVLDQKLFRTEFVESKATTVKGASAFQKDKRFVDLVFKVTNLSERTIPVGAPSAKPSISNVSFGGSLLKVSPEIKQEFGPRAFALDKGVETRQLHPGVTSTVIVRYELEGTQRPPKEITLDVAEFEYAPGFNDPSERWQLVTEDADNPVPAVHAQVKLQVRAEGGA